MGKVLPFLGVSLLVIVTPGQDTALTIRNTLVGGRVGGVFTAIGISAGQAAWTIATSVGVGALLLGSGRAFVALKLVGSGYIMFLGTQALVRALRGHGAAPAALKPAGYRLVPVTALRQGLLSNLSNPKMLAFFTSLLPQFAGSFLSLLLLGLVFCSLTLAWLTAYSFAVSRASTVLGRPRVRRSVEAFTGMALIALGLRLATARRW